MARDEWDSARAEWEAASSADSSESLEWDTYVPPEDDTPGRSVEERTVTPAGGARRARGRIIAAAVVAALVGAGGLGGALSQGGDDDGATASGGARMLDSTVLEGTALADALDQAAAEAASHGAQPYKVYARADVVQVEMVDEDDGLLRHYQEIDFDDDTYRVVSEEWDGEPKGVIDLAAVDPDVLTDLVAHVVAVTDDPSGWDLVVVEGAVDGGEVVVGSWADEPVHVRARLDGTILSEEHSE